MIHCLRSLNIKEGDIVGISSENRSEFLYVTFASICLNATVTTVNISYTERELEHTMTLSKPKVFFASKTISNKVSKIAQQYKFVQHIFEFDSEYATNNIRSYRKLFEDKSIKHISNYTPKPTNIRDTVAFVMYSSGTTGIPKGVQVTQLNVMSLLNSREDPEVMAVAGMPILSVVPWFHTMGCMTTLMAISKGIKLISLPKFEEKLFLGSIEVII